MPEKSQGIQSAPSLFPPLALFPPLHLTALPSLTPPNGQTITRLPHTQSKSLGAPHNGTSLTQAHVMPAGFEPQTSESAADHLSARQSGGQEQQARGQR
jgi:hypothetical protein